MSGRSGLVLAVAIVSCALGGTGCGREAPGRLVLLISLDTLRADHLGAYGYPRSISPNLDALAARGVVFEDAMAAAPWTLPSHASMLTGRYPSHHGLVAAERTLPAAVPTLAETLRAHGVHTAAAVNVLGLSRLNGLDRGFEHLYYVPEHPTPCAPTTVLVDQVLAWAEAYRGTKAFLFLHIYDIHNDYCALSAYEAPRLRPYAGTIQSGDSVLRPFQRGLTTVDNDDRDRLVDLYDAAIAQTDDEVGRLLLNLELRGLGADTTVILVSDHGESFLEHGTLGHSTTQFQELLHVPLIIAGALAPSGRRIDTPVSLVDVTPTVLAMFGLPTGTGLDGVGLERTWGGAGVPQRTLFSQATMGERSFDRKTRIVTLGRPDDDLWAARRGPYKLVHDLFFERTALYDLRTDPGEHQDLAAAEPQLVTEVDLTLFDLETTRLRDVDRSDLADDEAEALEALGYLR